MDNKPPELWPDESLFPPRPSYFWLECFLIVAFLAICFLAGFAAGRQG